MTNRDDLTTHSLPVSVAQGYEANAVGSNGPGLSLRENFSWTLVGNVVYAISQWGMLALLAKLGSTEMVGHFALGLAVSAPIIILANLGLRPVQATDARRLFRFGQYLALRLLTTVLALSTLVLVVLLGYQGIERWVILGVGVAKGVEALSDIYYGLLQQYEQMDRIARSLIIKGPLSLIFLGMGVLITRNVVGGVTGLIVARLVILVAYDIPSGRWLVRKHGSDLSPEQDRALKPSWDWRHMGRLSWLAAPLGVTSMFISLNTNVPRYVLERYWSAHELGIYAALAYLFMAGTTVIAALGQSASPRLAKYYASRNKKAFRRLLLRLLAFGVLLGIVGIVISHFGGRFILTLFYDPEYANHVDVLAWLAIAATVGFIASFLGYGLTAARYFRIQPFIFVGTTLTSLLFSLSFIPSYGMIGAAWALLCSNLLQLLAVSVADLHAIRSLT